jgi:methylated-DNA-[protein]-cysteine S-methyltransferase
VSDGEALTGLYPESHKRLPALVGFERNDAFFTGVRDQLDAYFSGRLKRFEVPLRLHGTAFQKRVWAALAAIPFGVAMSYRAVAEALGNPKATRAVGLANGKNPISIIVPCHRVVSADGSLNGYAGGLEMKRWLLQHEATPPQRGALSPTVLPQAPAPSVRLYA